MVGGGVYEHLRPRELWEEDPNWRTTLAGAGKGALIGGAAGGLYGAYQQHKKDKEWEPSDADDFESTVGDGPEDDPHYNPDLVDHGDAPQSGHQTGDEEMAVNRRASLDKETSDLGAKIWKTDPAFARSLQNKTSVEIAQMISKHPRFGKEWKSVWHSTMESDPVKYGLDAARQVDRIFKGKGEPAPGSDIRTFNKGRKTKDFTVNHDWRMANMWDTIMFIKNRKSYLSRIKGGQARARRNLAKSMMQHLKDSRPGR